MLKAEEFPEALRVLGQWLDAQGATTAEIAVGAHRLNVEWEIEGRARCSRSFTRYDLTRISRLAEHRRVQPLGRPSGRWSIYLRAIGQQIAETGLDPTRVQVDGHGLRLAGVLRRRYVYDWYSFEDLLIQDRVRGAERSISALRQQIVDSPPALPRGTRMGFAHEMAALVANPLRSLFAGRVTALA